MPYPSHREINAVRTMLGQEMDAEWVPTDGDRVSDLERFHGIWFTPGSPYADDTAAYQAVEWARERDVPFLGTCGGLQYALIEYFRNVLDVPSASHAESDGIDGNNVVHALACSLHGEERVIRPITGTRFSRLVNDEPFVGMHYCNYGPGSEEIRRLVEGGMVIEATAEDAEAEVIELPRNRFFMSHTVPAADRCARPQAIASPLARVRPLCTFARGRCLGRPHSQGRSRFHQCDCLRSGARFRPNACAGAPIGLCAESPRSRRQPAQALAIVFPVRRPTSSERVGDSSKSGASGRTASSPDSVEDAQALQSLHRLGGSIPERVEGLGGQAEIFNGDVARLEGEAPSQRTAARW